MQKILSLKLDSFILHFLFFRLSFNFFPEIGIFLVWNWRIWWYFFGLWINVMLFKVTFYFSPIFYHLTSIVNIVTLLAGKLILYFQRVFFFQGFFIIFQLSLSLFFYFGTLILLISGFVELIFLWFSYWYVSIDVFTISVFRIHFIWKIAMIYGWNR